MAHEIYHSFQGKEIKLYEEEISQGSNAYDGDFSYNREREKVVKKWKEEFDEYIDREGEGMLGLYYFQM